MRKRALLAASAAALFAAGPLAAQTAPSGQPGTAPTAPPAPVAPATPAPAAPMVPPAGSAAGDVNSENRVHVMIDGGAGMRTSKLVGASVYDGNGDEASKIGSVDDIILGSDQSARTAVLSVGGFLGLGSKLVAVPFDELTIATNGRVVLPGATVDNLKARPDFTYRTAGRD